MLNKPSLKIAAGLLAAVTLVAAGVLATQPEAEAEADCCPCEREAAYVANVNAALAGWSEGMQESDRRFRPSDVLTLLSATRFAYMDLLGCLDGRPRRR